VVLPNMGLLSMGVTVLCIGAVLTVKDHAKKQMLKCKKCGETKMRTKGGHIFCKNGHRVTIAE
jgi:tartrate dehydratase beta subunit/fumarate hydratase class I family protein